MVYAGEGVIYAGASAELKSLAELANAPVITTLKAKGAFPEDHPLFVGVRGDQVDHYLNICDLETISKLVAKITVVRKDDIALRVTPILTFPHQGGRDF